ncbi:hypothetical protein COO60DRAFT_199617 [Scenedesmus sp. NREL 46B-D3]|nr:hypothetical protein COO60DRAFT_199617 [Scenedesmus sp. NREL 46B-D3]
MSWTRCRRACAPAPLDANKNGLQDWWLWILPLPAASELSSGAIVRLLHTAIDFVGESVRGLYAIVAMFLRLPAAATISVDDMAQLLQAALQCNIATFTLLDGIWELPAAVQLRNKAAVQLLRMAADPTNKNVTGQHAFVQELCSLLAAATISSEDMEQLLQAALKRKPGAFASFDYDLLELPPALELSADAIVRLLRTAINSVEEFNGAKRLVKRLLSLPAAATISSEDTEQLLPAALHVTQQAAGAAAAGPGSSSGGLVRQLSGRGSTHGMQQQQQQVMQQAAGAAAATPGISSLGALRQLSGRGSEYGSMQQQQQQQAAGSGCCYCCRSPWQWSGL